MHLMRINSYLGWRVCAEEWKWRVNAVAGGYKLVEEWLLIVDLFDKYIK